MNGISAINLLPAPYRQERRQRKLLRRSLIAAGVYTSVIIGASGAVLAWCGASSGHVERMLVEAELERTVKAAQTEQAALTEAERKLAAAQILTRQPDWSLLGAIVAAQIDDDAALTEFRLEAPKVETADPSMGNRELILRGIARSYAAASGLVLRMEQLKLFDAVVLEKTDREPLASGEGVSFRIRCVLGGGAS